MPWRSPWWCRVLPAAAAASCERHTHGDRERSRGVLQPTSTRTRISSPSPQSCSRQVHNSFRKQGLLPPPTFRIYQERNLKKKQLAKAFADLPEEGHMGLCSNADPVLLMRFCYCIMDNHRYHHISVDCFKLLWWLVLWKVSFKGEAEFGNT